MKKLLYKEFVLCMHPLCYIFALVFPFMFLIPNYPLFVGTLYIVPLFSILFLGAKKGVQSNDLFYSALLPIRKKDIVLARMASVVSMEVITLTLMGVLYPIKKIIQSSMIPSGQPIIPGINSVEGILSSFAFAIIGYLLVNGVFFLMFYKSGRSITAPTLISTFGYIVFMMVFTCILPAASSVWQQTFVFSSTYIQLGFFLGAILIFIIGMFFIYKKASKELEMTDL